MKVFAGLRKLKLLESKHLPFVRSRVEFDLIIEIGYHEERGKPLTFKQLVGLRICSRNTAHRRLRSLIEQGIVLRVHQASDKRVAVFRITQFTLQRFNRYSTAIAAAVAMQLA